jgi:hypothetical protein
MKKKSSFVTLILLAVIIPAIVIMVFACSGGGSSSRPEGPCDIYTASGYPCVTAHSTTRALYASYNGPLYQVMRQSDSKTLDIGLVMPVKEIRVDMLMQMPRMHSAPMIYAGSLLFMISQEMAITLYRHLLELSEAPQKVDSIPCR